MCETAYPTGESEKAVEEEDTTFDKMRQAVEDVLPTLEQVSKLIFGKNQRSNLQIFLPS
jgi:hypothetical protein